MLLLRFLVDNCVQLFELYQFRITDSQVGPTHVSGASITLESKDVRIFLFVEREEIMLTFSSRFDGCQKPYSFYFISKILGREEPAGVMNDSNALFISSNWDKILQLFSKQNYIETTNRLEKMEADWKARKIKSY